MAFPALGCDLSDALGGFEPGVLEFLLMCSEAGEFAVQGGQASMVRTGRSHLVVELVDAALRTLELAFEPCELLFSLDGSWQPPMRLRVLDHRLTPQCLSSGGHSGIHPRHRAGGRSVRRRVTRM